jgi:hypothetical protein
MRHFRRLGELFLTILHFCYGIAEAVILSESLNAKSACGLAVWYCILVRCIVHFFMFVIYLADCGVGLRTLSERITDLHTFDNEIRFNNIKNRWRTFSLASSIWACICLYGTESDCVTYFEDNYKKLWAMLGVEVYTFFVLRMFSGCLFIFGKKSSRRSCNLYRNREVPVPPDQLQIAPADSIQQFYPLVDHSGGGITGEFTDQRPSKHIDINRDETILDSIIADDEHTIELSTNITPELTTVTTETKTNIPVTVQSLEIDVSKKDEDIKESPNLDIDYKMRGLDATLVNGNWTQPPG